MSITVFGSVNVDLTAYVERLPRPGVRSHATNYATGLGGKGANQAVAGPGGFPRREDWSIPARGAHCGKHFGHAGRQGCRIGEVRGVDKNRCRSELI